MAKTHGSEQHNGPCTALNPLTQHTQAPAQGHNTHRLSAPLLGTSLTCNSTAAETRQAPEANGGELPTNTMLLAIPPPSLDWKYFWSIKTPPVCVLSQNLLRFDTFRAKMLRGSCKGAGCGVRQLRWVSALPLEGWVSPALGLGVTYMLMSVKYHPRILCQQFSSLFSLFF